MKIQVFCFLYHLLILQIAYFHLLMQNYVR